MHIGFDAKRLFCNQTGLGNYSRNLVRGLCEQFPEHSYSLFTPRIEYFDNFNFQKQCQLVLPQQKCCTSLFRIFGMAHNIVRKKIDVFHGLSHEIPIGLHKKNIPTVVTIHDFAYKFFTDDFPFIDRKIYDFKWKYACTHADKIIATSIATKEDIIRFFAVPESKIEVIYQSCDDIFRQKTTEDWKQNIRQKYALPETFLLFVGSVTSRKNVLSLVHAYEHIHSQIDIPLVICGKGGAYRNSVIEYVHQKNLHTKVLFLDTVETIDLPALYQSAQLSVYPSNYEGFGIPVLESLASGTTVLTSNRSCLPEVGGEAAFYCNPDSVESIADAILTALQSFGDASVQEKNYAQAARFSQQKFIEQNMAVYRELS
ncbi:MAG: glycosyltransferase family 1 protein [Bacteroidales bacterium]|jgi:glycosyltransferase involved in cell wall biosynthesis|nr:glycosyltransferase family 1 protein [Bacteroidales bacterium]